jgi:hypothetical protein
MGGGDNPLDSFFPFDPYLLFRSSRFVRPSYINWTAAAPDSESEDEDEDEDEGDGAGAAEPRGFSRARGDAGTAERPRGAPSSGSDSGSESGSPSESEGDSEEENSEEETAFGFDGSQPWPAGPGMGLSIALPPSLGDDLDSRDFAGPSALPRRGKRRRSGRRRGTRSRAWSQTSLASRSSLASDGEDGASRAMGALASGGEGWRGREKERSATAESLNPRPRGVRRRASPRGAGLVDERRLSSEFSERSRVSPRGDLAVDGKSLLRRAL